MEKDQAIGVLMFLVSIAVIITYGWLLFFTAWTMIVLQITVFVAAAAILAILAWIGWTMATTPPPKPIDEEVALTTESKETSEEESKE
ncbi:MAG: transcriptional regulator [archaeon]|nr:transcriptional regulator [archaeon]MCP8305636.1 transcriptional regulator [archaeon]